MRNPMRDAGFSGVTPLLFMYCVGCTSLENLSSYSAGAADAGPRSLAQAPAASAPVAPAPRSSDAGPGPSAAESQNPSDVALIPTETESVDAADDCAGAGEFSGPESGACYLIADTTSSWRDARESCEAWGGELALVGSSEENEFLASRCDNDVWLGANDFVDEGTFRWLDGDLVDAEGPWAATQPDNFEGRENCLELRASGDEWNDASCTTNKRALCERPAASQGAN